MGETHQKQEAELDAGSTLELGRFTDLTCLSNSEVAQVLTRKLQGSAEKDENDPARDMQLNIKEYLERFTHFESQESIGAVRKMMDEKREEKVSEGVNLTRFEMTQLSNLCPSSAEEAKSLVKSLEHKIADDDLQQLLDEMAAHRKYE